MRMHRKLALGAATLALVLSACSSGEGESPSSAASQQADLPEVSMGSAGFPEAALVAEIYAQALEAQGFTVERHLELGERPAVRAAFDSGDINIAPDYLGGLGSLLESEVSSDADATHDALVTALEEIGQTALDFSPGTDADGFAVRQETADEFSLANMTDLAGVADQLVWGLATGCPDNPVCGPAPARCDRDHGDPRDARPRRRARVRGRGGAHERGARCPNGRSVRRLLAGG